MAILMVFEVPGGTVEQYECVNELLGIRGDADAPDGVIVHFAAVDESGVTIADVWESEEALNQFFGAHLAAALQEAGVEAGQPSIYPVHNMIAQGGGGEPRALVLIDAPGVSPAQYDAMAARMEAHTGPPENHPASTHVAGLKDGGVFVVDAWESPEAFMAFAQSEIAPAGEAEGIAPLQPRILRLHNRVRGNVTASA
jgi:heme-degrading monooxygenase HmoA